MEPNQALQAYPSRRLEQEEWDKLVYWAEKRLEELQLQGDDPYFGEDSSPNTFSTASYIKIDSKYFSKLQEINGAKLPDPCEHDVVRFDWEGADQNYNTNKTRS